MALRQVSLWLQPEQAQAVKLDAVIERLAAVHSTAVFPAHLTLLGPLDREVDAALSSLDEVARQLDPLEVRFGETRCEPPWHRSLYLVAVPESALSRAFQVAVQAFGMAGFGESRFGESRFGERSKPGFEPHLSLQYSQLPMADKVRLAEGLAGMPRIIRFDRLSLWHTTGSDAGRWRLIADRPLLGGSGR